MLKYTDIKKVIVPISGRFLLCFIVDIINNWIECAIWMNLRARLTLDWKKFLLFVILYKCMVRDSTVMIASIIELGIRHVKLWYGKSLWDSNHSVHKKYVLENYLLMVIILLFLWICRKLLGNTYKKNMEGF